MDPLLWAFAAPFVSLAMQLCGLFLAVGYLSYSQMRTGTPLTQNTGIMIFGVLIALLIFAILPITLEIQLLIEYSIGVPVLFILMALLLSSVREPRLFDAIFGLALGWGVAACSPAYATLTQPLQQLLFAFGLVILFMGLTLLASLLDRSPEVVTEQEPTFRVNVGLIGVIAASIGLAVLWGF